MLTVLFWIIGITIIFILLSWAYAEKIKKDYPHYQKAIKKKEFNNRYPKKQKGKIKAIDKSSRTYKGKR